MVEQRTKRKPLSDSQAQGKTDLPVGSGSNLKLGITGDMPVQVSDQQEQQLQQQQTQDRTQQEQQTQAQERTGQDIQVQGVNKPLLAVARFLGAEFTQNERGELSLTRSGATRLARNAVISGAVSGLGSALLGVGRGALASKQSGQIAGNWVSEASIKRALGTQATPNRIAAVSKQIGNLRVNQVASQLLKAKTGFFSGKLAKASLAGGMLTWFGADNLSTQASVSANNIESNVIFGQMSKADGLNELQTQKVYNNIARGALLAGAAISPLTIPLAIFGFAGTQQTSSNIDRVEEVINNA